MEKQMGAGGGGGGSKKKVMVAIDESESSYYAFMWVLDNLKEYITDSPLVIFAAQPTPNHTYFVYGAYLGTTALFSQVLATNGLINVIQEQNKKVVLGIMEKAVKICASRGVKAEAITEAGEPRELICEAVQKEEIDLLVTGEEAIGTFKRVFQGSLSSYCLNNAKCPVLVVKKPE